VVELLLCKCEALSANSSPTKRKIIMMIICFLLHLPSFLVLSISNKLFPSEILTYLTDPTQYRKIIEKNTSFIVTYYSR
jgi:hypothetical protein